MFNIQESYLFTTRERSIMSFRFFFLGGIEQPKVQSVFGLFRRESVCTPDNIDCQETVDEADETDEYTPAQMDSPVKTKGTWRKAEGWYVCRLLFLLFFLFLFFFLFTRFSSETN